MNATNYILDPGVEAVHRATDTLVGHCTDLDKSRKAELHCINDADGQHWEVWSKSHGVSSHTDEDVARKEFRHVMCHGTNGFGGMA